MNSKFLPTRKILVFVNGHPLPSSPMSHSVTQVSGGIPEQVTERSEFQCHFIPVALSIQLAADQWPF